MGQRRLPVARGEWPPPVGGFEQAADGDALKIEAEPVSQRGQVPQNVAEFFAQLLLGVLEGSTVAHPVNGTVILRPVCQFLAGILASSWASFYSERRTSEEFLLFSDSIESMELHDPTRQLLENQRPGVCATTGPGTRADP